MPVRLNLGRAEVAAGEDAAVGEDEEVVYGAGDPVMALVKEVSRVPSVLSEDEAVGTGEVGEGAGGEDAGLAADVADGELGDRGVGRRWRRRRCRARRWGGGR